MRRAAPLPVLGLLAVLALSLAGCSRGEARPEGIAERWLHAVSDHGRDGLRADAEERMRAHGDPALGERIVPPDAEEDERTFSDLEVGKAALAGDTARVPFRASARVGDNERREVTGTAVLTRADGEWLVADIQRRGPEEQVPSEGGDRPASATAAQWLVSIALAVLVTIVAVVLIEAQPGAAPAARR